MIRDRHTCRHTEKSTHRQRDRQTDVLVVTTPCSGIDRPLNDTHNENFSSKVG